jgi:hypothetical protein
VNWKYIPHGFSWVFNIHLHGQWQQKELQGTPFSVLLSSYLQ